MVVLDLLQFGLNQFLRWEKQIKKGKARMARIAIGPGDA